MHRAIPGSGNKFLTKKWEEKRKMVDNKKLKNVRSQVDLSAPSSYGLTKKAAKRDQLVENRFIEIERDNKHLLNKMKQILTNDSKFSVQDRKMHKWPTKKNTLHAGFRKRELERITRENYNILRRIQEK
mmetsp:Transcript_25639/g.25444  ORF Transcript_25639/g.25444 Transcript_25639/m.25444 type:complete len:129 (+) Transcript_25639:32-418(+)